MDSSTQSASGGQNRVWKGLGGRRPTVVHTEVAPTSREKSRGMAPCGQKGEPSGYRGSAAAVSHTLNKLPK